MNMWIARDENGRLNLHPIKPLLVRKPLSKMAIWCTEFEDWMSLCDESFPEVTFENSPQEVELVLKK